MAFVKITEQDSKHHDLEEKSIPALLEGIHQEDRMAVNAVGGVLDNVANVITAVVQQLQNGGRLFYLGAGTSGRLGVLDASECPPTFGTDPKMVVGVIAGGTPALSRSIEKSEDDENQGWKDLSKHEVNAKDMVIGIAASGTTPYVVGGLQWCQAQQIPTACITCNEGSPLAAVSDYPIEVVVGPEFVTGSSRMKAGTVQKLILNMITTVSMIQLGRVKGNKMVDMQLTNEKLHNRAARILMEEQGISKTEAKALLERYGNVRKALDASRDG